MYEVVTDLKFKVSFALTQRVWHTYTHKYVYNHITNTITGSEIVVRMRDEINYSCDTYTAPPLLAWLAGRTVAYSRFNWH